MESPAYFEITSSIGAEGNQADGWSLCNKSNNFYVKHKQFSQKTTAVWAKEPVDLICF